MNNSMLVKNQSENTKKAEKYICKYLNELKIHFNLSDCQIIRILGAITQKMKKTSKPQSVWKFFSKK